MTTHPLQTTAWEDFRQKWGNVTARVDGHLLTLHKIPLINKKIAIFEKGPEPTQQMLDSLKAFGKKQNLIFIKLEPNFPASPNQPIHQFTNLLRANSAVPGKTIFTPTTFWIDLTKSEDDLLKSFKPKTRYNIKVAQKHGVEVLEDNSNEAFEKYLELTRQTSQRQGFYAHSEKYHRLMWEALRNAKIAHLLTARFNNEIITTWILFHYDNFLYYPYGASSNKYKGVMANNLMMWEAIKLGKRLGAKTFDLWGREPGKGFTPFKEGYNPQVVEFVGTWDLVINKPFYYLYRAAEILRWAVLRLKTKFSKPGF